MPFANKEEQRAYHRAWYAKHKQECRARADKWNREHPARFKQAGINWRRRRPFMTMMTDAKNRAKLRGLPFDLTKEWAEARWTGRCELTGIPFEVQIGKGGSGPRSPSLDRMEPSAGYTQGNCRFILQALNMLKGSGTDEDMRAIARALLEKQIG